MKAIVQEGAGSADVLHLREIDMPVVTDDLVRVRVRAASVNALDSHIVHGGRLVRVVAFLLRSPVSPVRGVDVAGHVDAVGKNVKRLRVGDEVFGVARGTFAEYATTREDRLAPKPRRVSFAQAAAIGIAGVTALQGLRDGGQVRPGQRVLIYGAGGGVGTFAVQIAKALGAHVTAVTGPRNVDLARSLGADEVIDYTKEDVARRPERYDAVIDVAATRSLSSLRRVLAPNGIFVQVGAPKRGGWIGIFARIANVMVRARLFHQRVVFYVAKTDLGDLEYLTELIGSGKLRPAIDRTYPLAEGAEAVRYVGTGQARAKVVITMS